MKIQSFRKNGGLSEPNPRVHFSIEEKILMSVPQTRTTNPRWNENHYFFIQNPETETLTCRIKDEKSSDTIATCHIPLTELLNESLMTLERGFELVSLQSSPGYAPKLFMKLSLKVELFFRAKICARFIC